MKRFLPYLEIIVGATMVLTMIQVGDLMVLTDMDPRPNVEVYWTPFGRVLVLGALVLSSVVTGMGIQVVIFGKNNS